MSVTSPPRPDRRRLALIVTPICALVALLLVAAVGDVPLGRRGEPVPGRRRAAVAMRDHVIPFQEWGTELFTVPSLEAGYDDVVYLTQVEPFGERAEFIAALDRALRDHDEVDLFLLAHGNRFIDWVRTIDPALLRRLRLVYNTGCGNATQAEEWLALGARAYVGHPSLFSNSPAFYFYFLRRWVRGWPLDEAVAAANRAAVRRLGWFGLDDPRADPRAVRAGDGELVVGGAR